jgi:hypothetical protein
MVAGILSSWPLWDLIRASLPSRSVSASRPPSFNHAFATAHNLRALAGRSVYTVGAMLGLSVKDSSLLALLLLSSFAFWVASRWSGRLSADRAMTIYSVGFSVAFVLLALLSGLSVMR